jgi:hypothetical protein
MKNWNWTLFWVILMICFVGAATDKKVNNIWQGIIIASSFDIPLGLLWAWLTKTK